MSKIAMSGADTIKLNGRILVDLADGDCVALTTPNDIANVKTGKNGNSIFGLNESGKQADLAIRVIRGSDDDKFLNNLMAQQNNDFSSFILMQGEFTKRLGDGAGTVLGDSYIVSGGCFGKQTEAKSNVEGDTEQSIAIYHMKFAKCVRVIG